MTDELRKETERLLNEWIFSMPMGDRIHAIAERNEHLRALQADNDRLRAELAEREGQEPVAWRHDNPARVDVIADEVKRLLNGASASAGYLHRPLDKSARYTIPLYRRPPSPRPAAPEGWKLTPRQPTASMIGAAERCHEECGDMFYSASTGEDVRFAMDAATWGAMWDNAPTPPAEGETEGYSLVPTEILDRFPEINPSNYDHDGACDVNAWGVEVVTAAVPSSSPNASGDGREAWRPMNELQKPAGGQWDGSTYVAAITEYGNILLATDMGAWNMYRHPDPEG